MFIRIFICLECSFRHYLFNTDKAKLCLFLNKLENLIDINQRHIQQLICPRAPFRFRMRKKYDMASMAVLLKK